jgi:hypothetical protein
MNRRRLLVRAGMAALASIAGPGCTPSAPSGGRAGAPFRRVRPGDPSWPSAASWERLNRQTAGQLITVRSPLADSGLSSSMRRAAYRAGER